MKISRIVLLAFILIFLFTASAFADELTEAEEQKEYIDNQLEGVSNKKAEELYKLNQAQSKINNILNEQEEAGDVYSDLQNAISRLDSNITILNKTIADTENDYQEKLKKFKTRLKSMYQNNNASYLAVLMESENVSDFFQRIEYLVRFAKEDRKIMQEITNIKKDLEVKETLLEEEKAEKERLSSQQLQYINNLSVSRANLDYTIRKTSAEYQYWKQMEDELAAQAMELSRLIINYKGGETYYAGGGMIWPSPGYYGISSSYGSRLHPILGVYRMHTGIDINAPWGSNVVAANDGIVMYSGYQSGYGNTVIIDHGGGIATLYAHCSSLLVWTGSLVDKGMLIAKAGSTGLSTGPHLHFEVRYNGETTDPLNYVSP